MKIEKEDKKLIGTMRITCYKCGKEVQINSTDLKKTNSANRYDTRYQYDCPCCSRINYLVYKSLPEDIQDILLDMIS